MPDIPIDQNFEDIRNSLKSLGLEPGVTVEEVHTAFRALVRTCHPDVVGRQGAARFQEITNAYSVLKGLTDDMLIAAKEVEISTKSSDRRGRGTLFDWYQKRRREQLDDNVKPTSKSRDSKLPTSRRIDRLLEQYEREISSRLEKIAKDATKGQIDGLLLRLRSSVPEVRCLALSRLDALVNNEKILPALVELLCVREMDSETARLLNALPITEEALRSVAKSMANRAPKLLDNFVKHTSPAVRLWGRALMKSIGQPA